MTHVDLIREITSMYRASGRTLFPASNIKRGRNRSISSQVEDLFAYYMAKNQPSDCDIYIDQTLSFKLNDRNKVIYPDITVVKDKQVVQIWELKMDVG